MNKKILGMGLFAFAFIFGQTVFANDNFWKCDDGFQQMMKSLKLDNGQQAKIQVTQEQLKTQMKSKWEKIKGLHEQINQLVQSDNMDQSKLDNLIDTKAQLIGKIIKAKTMAEHQIYLVLNPQQKKQYQQMSQQLEEKIAKKYSNCSH